MPTPPVNSAAFPVLRVTPGDAAGAYARTMDGTGAAAGPDFGAVLSNAIDSAITNSANAERKATAALEGRDVSITDVVTSVERAGATLQVTAALRDRMVQAWQMIMSMSI